MKKLLFFFCMTILCLSSGCDDNKQRTETVTYKINEPVFMDANTFRQSVKVSTVPIEVQKQGKICFFQGYLYISEPEKGIHIIDNRNPSDPKNIGFIELMGNADLAIRNDLLYADSYIDLVWFDIVNPAKPELKGRLEEAFPQALPIIGNGVGYDYNMCYTNNNEKKIVVGWTLAERTETYVVEERPGFWWQDNMAVADYNKGNGGVGANGSMSRFGLYQDYLYSVMLGRIGIFDLSGDKPVKIGEDVSTAWDVETIFSYKDNIFLGTSTGMQIYSVKDPLKPIFQSSLQHVYGCDPVVVENDLAYVTIRSGNFCGQNNNELFIIDVSDVKKPKQIVSYTMTNPKGLGIDNGTLFLCDDGLKIYKSEDPQKLMSNQIKHYKGMDGFDVIPFNNVLMMIADDGLYQYDYSDLNNIKQLSKFAFK